eukprot:UC4_evm1s1464
MANNESVDQMLMNAETEWQQGNIARSTSLFDSALDIVRASGDKSREGIILLGKGVALSSTGDRSMIAKGVQCIEQSRKIAQEDGQASQVHFATTMIEQITMGLKVEDDDSKNENKKNPEDAIVIPSKNAVSHKDTVSAFVENLVKRSHFILLLKGTRDKPQCSHSKYVIQKLSSLGAQFDEFDVLCLDVSIKEALKAFAQWPTFPQLWIGGELVGGADVVRQLEEERSLIKFLEEKGVTFLPLPTSSTCNDEKYNDQILCSRLTKKQLDSFSFTADEQALIDMIAKNGATDWI